MDGRFDDQKLRSKEMKPRIAILAVLAVVALLQAATNIAQTSRANTSFGFAITRSIPQQTGTAVLSVASGFATQPGTVNPLGGRTFVLFRESFAGFLRRKGMFQGPPGSTVKVSPLAAWVYACQIQSPACQQALYEARPNSVSEAKADLNGKATLPGVPSGTYYLFAITPYNKQPLVWDLRVDLKPGANSVTLDQRNVAPLDDNSAGVKPSGGSNTAGASRPCQVTDERRAAEPVARANSTLSVRGTGYVYTYTRTDRRSGEVLDSSTERGNFTNTTLYLLDEDADVVLQKAGVETGILGSRLAMFTLLDAGTQVGNVPVMDVLASLFGHKGEFDEFTKERQAEFDCVMKAIRAHSVAEVTTDANARGTFSRVPAGTYYLFGRFYRVTKPVRAGGVLWNLPLQLRLGQNTLALSVDNAALKNN
jgi:hypothetical protein